MSDEHSAEAQAESTCQADLLHSLESGPSYPFAAWPNESVPKVAAGVYTIWDAARLIYVGMAGRSMRADEIDSPDEPVKAKGLWTRLKSHASGRRSADQFCVYVCDRFVVPALSVDQQAQIAEGRLALDKLTRDLIRDRYAYRFAPTSDGAAAFALEREIQRGALNAGKPFLNPLQ